MIQGQFGNTHYVAAGRDLTAATDIILTITRPHVVKEWSLVGGGIQIGTVDLDFGGVIYPANTYVFRVFEEGDITQAGKHKVTLTATINGALCPSSTSCFTVNKRVGPCSC